MVYNAFPHYHGNFPGIIRYPPVWKNSENWCWKMSRAFFLWEPEFRDVFAFRAVWPVQNRNRSTLVVAGRRCGRRCSSRIYKKSNRIEQAQGRCRPLTHPSKVNKPGMWPNGPGSPLRSPLLPCKMICDLMRGYLHKWKRSRRNFGQQFGDWRSLNLITFRCQMVSPTA
jgi:hypothetical protein